MEISFEYLDKNDFDEYAPKLFSLLYENMEQLVPSGESYEECFRGWCHAFGGAFKNRAERKIVLLFTPEREFIGFFGYLADEDTFHMEEIQLLSAYQGRYGIFRALFGFVINELKGNIKYAEAYAHKNNLKSQSVLKHLGLNIIGENKNGSCFHFKGEYRELVSWYEKK